jgi:hypothetical protein
MHQNLLADMNALAKAAPRQQPGMNRPLLAQIAHVCAS